ncbi:hypothetical protein ACS0TY_007005 [Phlomoides rotata]
MTELCVSSVLFGLDVEGARRGAIAREDLKVGNTALEIPVSVIISKKLLHESDMFTKMTYYVEEINEMRVEGAEYIQEDLYA